MKQTKEAVLSEAIRTIDGFLPMKEYHYEPDSEHQHAGYTGDAARLLRWSQIMAVSRMRPVNDRPAKGKQGMKRKRLNRDQWGFQYYPYYQMRMDHELFHGTVCLIRLTDGDRNYWETPKAGRIQVTGEGMTWLEMIPDDSHRVITAMYFPDGAHDPERKQYPSAVNEKYQPSVWYIDITEGKEYDEDGVAVFVDKYLDVIITPEGDVKVDDRDELDAAYASGDLTGEQYDAALAEGEAILRTYGSNICELDAWCAAVRQLAEDRIAAGEQITMCREVREWRRKQGMSGGTV